jgi:hypothetical protein
MLAKITLVANRLLMLKDFELNKNESSQSGKRSRNAKRITKHEQATLREEVAR